VSSKAMRSGVTTEIRKKLTSGLISAGDMVTIDPRDYDDATLRSLAVKIKQAVKSEPSLVTEQRTIDGIIHVRRINLKPALPGVSVSTGEVLNAMRPWRDDPLYASKVEALNTAIAVVSS